MENIKRDSLKDNRFRLCKNNADKKINKIQRSGNKISWNKY